MPAYNFKKRFASSVECGEKCQTIRARRKKGRDAHPNDILYLYTGMRTRACRKLREAPCTSVEDIQIFDAAVIVSGIQLEPVEVDRLTHADGFENTPQFFSFFREEHGFSFSGLLIKWEPLK